MNTTQQPLFDAHCHLQDQRLPALQHVLQEAAAAGVTHLSCNGCWPDDWERVAAAAAAASVPPAAADQQCQAQLQPAIIPNFGLHPWWVPRRSPDWLGRLRCMLEAHPSAGLGECGLDRGPRAPACGWQEQLEAFEAQLRLAEELKRPVSVHCVRAFGAVHDALRRLCLSVPVVLHSWTGAADMTAALARLPMPVYFSLSGHLTKVPPAKALPMVRAIPPDRLLLESDSPDGPLDLPPAWLEALPSLAHVPAELEAAGLRQVNRPCVLRWTLQLVAAAVEKPADEVAQHTWQNACRVFLVASRAGASSTRMPRQRQAKPELCSEQAAVCTMKCPRN
ncbi:hypothetical protein ABPG75_011248 [Micractinium tetrahymenae]